MVEYIKYQGEEYPIRISYYALKMMTKAKDIKVNDLASGKVELEIYEDLLFHALVAGAHVLKIEQKISKDEIQFVLDECFMEFVKMIPKFLPKAEKSGLEKKLEPLTAEKKEPELAED